MYLPLPCRVTMKAERQPLLGDQNGHVGESSFMQKVTDVLVARGEPGWIASAKFLLFASWFNVLLVFIPLALVADVLNWDAGLRFAFSFVAIIPLAKVSTCFIQRDKGLALTQYHPR